MAIQAELYPEKVGFAFSGPQGFVLENASAAPLASHNLFSTPNCLLPPQQHQLQYHHQGALLFDTDTTFLAPAFTDANLGIHDNNAKLEPFQFQATTFQDKETREIDQFIRAQNARLRVLLHEQRKRQIVALMKSVEARTAGSMRQKEEEIAKATRRSMELENLLRRLEMEKQVWQKVAQEKEAMMMSLNNAVEEMRERGSVCMNKNSGADAESCCCEEIGENRGVVDLDDDIETVGGCGVCKCRKSCVVFLPCRHLCSCKQCQVLVDSCPVCGSPKKSSIEVLIS